MCARILHEKSGITLFLSFLLTGQELDHNGHFALLVLIIAHMEIHHIHSKTYAPFRQHSISESNSLMTSARSVPSTTFAIHSSFDDFFNPLILLQPSFLLEPCNNTFSCFRITRGLAYVTWTAIQTTNSNHIVFQVQNHRYWQNKRRPTFYNFRLETPFK